jgi:hypothetical protein
METACIFSDWIEVLPLVSPHMVIVDLSEADRKTLKRKNETKTEATGYERYGEGRTQEETG